MRAKALFVLLWSLMLSIVLSAQSPQELYQRALVEEHANGNLNEAIKLYAQTAQAAGKDRALAAKALIRSAVCQEKLGRPSEAAESYAEVVRSYPEQHAEISIAQDRLNRLRQTLPARSQNSASSLSDVSALTAPLFASYCNNCHNTSTRSGGFDLSSLNGRDVSERSAAWETILRRLRARRDPPLNSPRPDPGTYRAVISKLEQALDGAYSANSPLNLAERTSDTEWSTRIAAFIWGSAPDAALIDDAQNGRLRDATVLKRQVLRMLRDPKAENLVTNFLQPWLLSDRLPAMDPELLQSMESEARLFLESQLREDRGVLELWTANYTYINDRLARHYGISGISGGFQRVRWPDGNRAGILGMAGMLAAGSVDGRTSPTRRGIYLFTRFLGMDPPAPPASVPPMLENPETAVKLLRDRLSAHKVNPSCANCHGSFDPLGLALENFDSVGQWRITMNGAAIDTSGVFIDGTPFNGPAELRAALLKHSDAYYTNVTQQLLAFALNRKGRTGRLYDYEMPAVRAIVRSAAADGYRWSAIVSGIIASAPFRMKNVAP
jgi:tetratricopeptide (TPR) repeat protein